MNAIEVLVPNVHGGPDPGVPSPSPGTASSARAGRFAKRLGAGAFLFFLVKGLAWLAVPAYLGHKALKGGQNEPAATTVPAKPNIQPTAPTGAPVR